MNESGCWAEGMEGFKNRKKLKYVKEKTLLVKAKKTSRWITK